MGIDHHQAINEFVIAQNIALSTRPAIVIVVDDSFSIGSGGSLTGSCIDWLPSGGGFATLEQEQTTPINSALDVITEAFSLTKEELAKVCQVTKKTIYNWTNQTSETNPKAMGRVFDLLSIAKDWKHSALPSNKQLLRMPVYENLSIVDLLGQEDLQKEVILFSGSRLKMTHATNTKLIDPFA